MAEHKAGPVARVAVAVPMDSLFDYLPGGADEAPPPAGTRVLVPFGHRQLVGLVVEIAERSEQSPQRLRPIVRALDPRPLFSALDLALVRWAAAYYRQPIGEAMISALPARLRRAEQALDCLVPGLRPTPEAIGIERSALSRAPAQRRLMELLLSRPGGIALDELRRRLGSAAGTIRALRDKGLVTDCRLEAATDAAENPAPAPRPAQAPALNPAQQRAVESVLGAPGGFAPFLLEGVTGSGKTEVYIRLIAATIATGRQALVLVPEIGLTPQLRERLERRLPGPIAVLHSGLNDSERERAWHLAADGRATLALGTRSACFVPLPRLGMILVDEEHDPSLKQQEGFRYSARDLAVRRAQLAGCPVVLGSATPALESIHNARQGRYARLHLPERAGGASHPATHLLDIRGQPLSAGLSPLLRDHVAAEISAGNQVLLFLNRRGFAPVQTCHDCGWVGTCPNCDARLTLHQRLARLWCHHCGWMRPAPDTCPECGGPDLRTLGIGTERLEDELAEVFPGSPLARIDRDSVRRKGELERLLAAVRRGSIRILLGTQMLAKGHDFPNVTLVGILDLDQSLYAADFRAPERTAQLIVQVAGRAGRADRPGRVVIQTRHPEHPLLQSLLRDGYPGFADLALAERAAASLPPFGFLALLRADATDAALPDAFLQQARELGLATGASGGARIQLRGPVPSPMQRRAGRYRAQLLVESDRRPELHAFLAPWVAGLRDLPRPGGLRWSLDVDPQDML